MTSPMSISPCADARLATVISSIMLSAAVGNGSDWPQYRGASHNGTSLDRIKQQWPMQGPAQLWRVPCTNGLSSLAVSGGRVFTQIRRNDGAGEKEMCVAMDARTGVELWASTMGAASYDSGVGLHDGPRSTPSVQGGRVFVLTSSLVLHCLNATNGTTHWSKDLRALYGGSSIGWQNAASPIVENDMIFLNGNTNGTMTSQSLFALRTTNGSVAWRTETAVLTHSTPVTATISGVPQVIFAAQGGLVSLNRSNGALLWRAPYPFRYDTSLAGSPVVFSNT